MPEAGFDGCGFGFGAGFGFGFGVVGLGLIFSGFGLLADGLFGLLGLLGEDLAGVGLAGDDFDGDDFPDSGFEGLAGLDFPGALGFAGLDLPGALGFAGPDLAGAPGFVGASGLLDLPAGAAGFAGVPGLAASPGFVGALGFAAGAPGFAGSAFGGVAGGLALMNKAPSVAAIAQKSRVAALMTSLSAIVLSKLKLQPGKSAPRVSTTCLFGSKGTFNTLRVF